jgi:hypothetical protein
MKLTTSIIILLMEALILSSRSITQDVCFQKEQKEKYRRHVDQIGVISRERQLGLK